MGVVFKREILWAVLFSIISVSAWAQSQPAPSLTESEKKGIVGRDLVFHRKYDEALAHFKKVAEEEPGSPLGTFGQMAVWQARMFENYDFKFDKEFEAVSQENKKVVDQVLGNKDSGAWDLFLAGASSGLRAFYLMRKDSPLRALSEGNRSHKALERAQEKDPSFKDVYLGLGMYEYWRSVFTNRIKILPFFSDKRKDGLAKLEVAYRENRVVGALAAASLAFCYSEERSAAKGIPYVEAILKTYPENVIAKNLLGDFYSMRGSYTEALKVFDGLIQKNPDVAVAKFFKGVAYFRMGNTALARKWFEEYLKTQPPPAWESYALTNLGRIDLKEGKDAQAYERFKKASRAYPDYSVPLKELQKLRQKGKRWF